MALKSLQHFTLLTLTVKKHVDVNLVLACTELQNQTVFLVKCFNTFYHNANGEQLGRHYSPQLQDSKTKSPGQIPFFPGLHFPEECVRKVRLRSC